MPPTAAPSRVPASRRPPTAARPSPGLRHRAARALRHASPAVLAYAAVRTLGLLVFVPWAHGERRGVRHLLMASWDCDWYLRIAQNGYAHELGTRIDGNNLAFFPLYPLLIRAGDALLPWLPRGAAGLSVSVAASLLAAWGIFAVGDRLYGRRAGVVLAVLWGSLPVALVQWMGYTESLFTALCAWSLYAVLSGRWLWAGSLAALAGLTRPTGVALAAAVSLTALLSLRRSYAPRPLLGALIAPLGWLAYVAWVGLRLGRWDGYFAVQKLWHNKWDGGVETVRRMQALFMTERPALFYAMVTAVLLGSVVLYVLSAIDRQPLPLLVFTGLLLLIVLGSSGVYFPRARFLLPGFPLLLPLAVALARARTPVLVTVLTAAALGSAAFGGHMLLGWHGPP
ncbi:glycosyltransferase family 39 protein [Streptomyces sp. NRRL S-920]|uniref:glycosyltransferase family 39 protein n=1 Tax=Streptomyces sp. NRRL S-920 TaxID=1463921 RepID=UPI0004C786CE|nr:glycosyltransferase family 39 protein [Streptomyces sp. NRRL S-920]